MDGKNRKLKNGIPERSFTLTLRALKVVRALARGD
jgi:hypothetical protein